LKHGVLIVDPAVDEYRRRLAPQFPSLAFDGKDPEVIIGFARDMDAQLIARAPRLRWVQALSSGTELIEKYCAARPDVVITSTRGVHGAPVSEMAFMFMLAFARDFRHLLRNQDRAHWEKLRLPLLLGKTATLLGSGAIASELARRCKAFGMKVLGVSRSPRALETFDAMLPRTELEQAAAAADFLIALLPHSAETEGIVGKKVLAAMKPSAYFINVSRGGVCDEDALLAALREKRIAGAGLDVFRTEPLPAEHPLWRLENVLVTPHVAGESAGYIDLVLPIVSANLECFAAGRWQDMLNVVPRSSTRKAHEHHRN
jgi:D-2-hydroxyacid dehydrogenase (NADP+)